MLHYVLYLNLSDFEFKYFNYFYLHQFDCLPIQYNIED